MKKTFFLLLLIVCTFTLVSCSDSRSSDELMSDFLSSYGADGVVYSRACAEGEYGYIDSELFHKIYVYEGEMPADFAVFLSSHTDSDSECGIFVCRDAAERIAVEQMCLERIELLVSDNSFISRRGNTVFYSTMSDRARAERIWQSIIRA